MHRVERGRRRALDDQVTTRPHFLDDTCLRCVGIDDVEQFFGRQHVVEPVFGTKERNFRLEAFEQQSARERVLRNRPIGPRIDSEIAVHEEFRERKETELHGITLDLPPGAATHYLRDLLEIGRGLPPFLYLDIRQRDAEIVLQPLLQRKVGKDVFVPNPDIKG